MNVVYSVESADAINLPNSLICCTAQMAKALRSPFGSLTADCKPEKHHQHRHHCVQHQQQQGEGRSK